MTKRYGIRSHVEEDKASYAEEPLTEQIVLSPPHERIAQPEESQEVTLILLLATVFN